MGVLVGSGSLALDIATLGLFSTAKEVVQCSKNVLMNAGEEGFRQVT